jgi:hypothetical protein
LAALRSSTRTCRRLQQTLELDLSYIHTQPINSIIIICQPPAVSGRPLCCCPNQLCQVHLQRP